MIGDFVLRLLVAGVLGAIVGLERESRAKEAGYRTHFLVALGSALIMIVSQYGFTDFVGLSGYKIDPSRIAAQVVSGIGFIGAGTIIFQKQIVRGLTTAAGIWTTSGIGMAVGAGMYGLGIGATVLTLIGLEVLTMAFKSLGMRSAFIELQTASRESLMKLTGHSKQDAFRLVSCEIEEEKHEGVTLYMVKMVVKMKRLRDEGELLSLLLEDPLLKIKKVE